MRRMISCVGCVAVLLGGVSAHDLRNPSFDYSDVERFGLAIAAIEGGTDPEQAFQAYLDGAGAGLYGWSTRYNIPASAYAEDYLKYRKFFKYLGSLAPALKAREAEVAADLVSLRDMMAEALDHPTLSILPTYYFVSPMGGGGSAEAIANMIAIDYYGRNPDAPLDEFADRGFWPEGKQLMQSLDAMIFVASHEMVHWYQTLMQGEIDYVQLYIEEGEDTLLGRAVREGGADFIARLASETYTQDQLDYGDPNEQALWAVFRGHIYELSDDNPGWFHGANPHFTSAPWQIGYYVGMRMCEAYYEAAEDKNAALRFILTADSKEQYEQIMRAYDAKWSAH